MKAFYIVVLFACYGTINAQTYFYEDFNYDSYAELDSLFDHRVQGNFWTTHFSENVDISENERIDSLEQIKSTSIVADPFNEANKVIRFELYKTDPKFYAKYACDDRQNDNVFADAYLDRVYNRDNNLYCYDCSSSPSGNTFNKSRNQMNRNEIAVYGPNKKMYQPNETHWFGMRTLVDKAHELDSIRNGEIITQFHFIEKTGNPPVAVSIINHRYYLVLVKNNDGKTEIFDLGAVEKGIWVEWIFKLVLSMNEQEGLLEIWKNGAKLHSIKGKNVYKHVPVYLKIGIYKWGWWDCGNPYNYSTTKIVSYDKVWAGKGSVKF